MTKVEGLRIRDQGLGFKVEGLGSRVWSFRTWVQGVRSLALYPKAKALNLNPKPKILILNTLIP